MKAECNDFPRAAQEALGKATLQASLKNIAVGFKMLRQHAIGEIPEWDDMTRDAAALKDHVLENLDWYLEQFTEKVEAAGGKVHFCADHESARQTIVRLCQEQDAKIVTKGKSMITEEIGVNAALEDAGITPVETDLGEYIIQLADERPSHIIGPAIHKSRDEVSDLFAEHHQPLGIPGRRETTPELVAEARKVLRDKYFEADVGITGANFVIAETGSTIIVTNEGNGDLTQILPRTHIVVSSIEKVIPTLEDLGLFLRLLARSATGQPISTYTTLSTGPRQANDPDGPENFHVVLLDGGRSKMLGGAMESALRCIRCGACMNQCPVYGAVGGHAYGWVYPGPIGAVLTPQLVGLAEARHLPQASTLCGVCEEVCPVRIPLPALLREQRTEAFEAAIDGQKSRWSLKIWSAVTRKPKLYGLLSRLGLAALKIKAKGRGVISRLPLVGGWTGTRDLPAPEGERFIDLWKAQKSNQRLREPSTETSTETSKECGDD